MSVILGRSAASYGLIAGELPIAAVGSCGAMGLPNMDLMLRSEAKAGGLSTADSYITGQSH
jgi:hypothetical protein